jgi:hypothetical protein
MRLGESTESRVLWSSEAGESYIGEIALRELVSDVEKDFIREEKKYAGTSRPLSLFAGLTSGA